jgi:hypothetical protein
MGTCRDYPACRPDGTCTAGNFCRDNRCVPGEVDIDGDGTPAGSDCDETNPNRHPGQPEACNRIDDNCDMRVDEGDPGLLCQMSPTGGICIDGACGCPAGRFDIDRMVPGCECMGTPAAMTGASCAAPIDMGDLADTGMMMTVTGNLMPITREVWYRFRGVDRADTACDNLHVRVQFRTNPSNAFEFTVFRGDCATVSCADGGYTDYSWSTDFRGTVGGMLAGQCPCAPAAAPVTDVSACTDDSAPYFVRVRRKAPATASCDPYMLEISNGVYDTM